MTIPTAPETCTIGQIATKCKVRVASVLGWLDRNILEEAARDPRTNQRRVYTDSLRAAEYYQSKGKEPAAAATFLDITRSRLDTYMADGSVPTGKTLAGAIRLLPETLKELKPVLDAGAISQAQAATQLNCDASHLHELVANGRLRIYRLFDDTVWFYNAASVAAEHSQLAA